MDETYLCPKCKSDTGHCPECGKEFLHGTASNCDEEHCKCAHAPIDCKCGYVVSHDKKGIITLSGNFIPFNRPYTNSFKSHGIDA